jgi:hypothetical protein
VFDVDGLSLAGVANAWVLIGWPLVACFRWLGQDAGDRAQGGLSLAGHLKTTRPDHRGKGGDRGAVFAALTWARGTHPRDRPDQLGRFCLHTTKRAWPARIFPLAASAGRFSQGMGRARPG